MYTVGQVADFLGVSRDTLKYYEEKELVNPVYDERNGYRKYTRFDIHDVITTNFYRELDFSIKKIQGIRKSKNVNDLKQALKEKETQILEEMEYKKLLLKQIKEVQEDCENIKEQLGTFSIKEMQPLEIKGQISDHTAYDEYEVVRKNTESQKKAVTLSGLRRMIRFDDHGMKEDHFIVVKRLDDKGKNPRGEVITHPKCIHMVIENGRAVNRKRNMDDEVGEHLFQIARENGYDLLGVAYINILLTTYEEGLERVFLEMYAPIKS